MTKKVFGRHGSRWVALQGLYAWQLSGAPLSRIEEDLRSGFHLEEKISFDKDYFHELMMAIFYQQDELDQLMLPYVDRGLSEIQPIEHAILWIAFYELKNKIETPAKVIINEAIILAKEFGATESHKFINGVLDKAAKIIREREWKACPA